MENKKYTPEENRQRFKAGEISFAEYMALPVEECLCEDGGLDDGEDEEAPPSSAYFEPE